ncbi:MAG: hypothetical protein J0M18_10430 [Ignavibacteria bacterium]|jgi:hypothetical protein|nr:hypothetical protein [Ignavibacteria bacterium]
MTQLTVVTQNEVSIIGENPFFINDASEKDTLKKEVILKEFQSKPLNTKNRSVNVIPSSQI